MARYGILTLLTACVLFSVCAKEADDSFKQGVGMYDQNKLEDALPYFETAAEKFGADSETYAYLAETYRRLGMRDEALEAAEKALTIDSCNSFAHTTLSYLYNPMFGKWDLADRDKAWSHITKGIDCNPEDGNLWLAAWTEAIFRKDRMMESKSLKMMIDTGFLTPAILAFNRWMLQHLPPNAILLTNGDMDTYPAVALQEARGFRTDVTVMNYSLLNTGWYQKHIQERYNIEFPFSDDELANLKPIKDKSGEIQTVASQIMRKIIEAKSQNRFDKQIAISVTVGDSGFKAGFEDHFVLKGAYELWSDKAVENRNDLDAITSSLNSLNLDDFTGPFVSASDRSPIRIVYTKQITSNFTRLAEIVIESRIKQNQPEKAMIMLQWATRANDMIVKDPEVTERLGHLRDQIQAEK